MYNSEVTKQNTWLGLYILASIILYGLFAYALERTQSLKLVLLYAGLFWCFYKLVSLLKHHPKWLTALAFGFRALFILAIPNLSQDFYRFIWDGRMLLEGFNPYLYTPQSLLNQGLLPVAQTQELITGMGSLSAGHFTNYPPLNQLCFVVAGLLAGKSIIGSAIVLRVIIIAADFGTLVFGNKLLKACKLPTHHIYWYLLNPFIIIELTGNLHFEGVMVFFLVWSLYLLHKNQWQWAAVLFACSVSVKLIPLLFLPLLYNWFMLPRPLDSARGDNPDKNTLLLSGRALSSSKYILNEDTLHSKSRPNGFLKLVIFYVIVFAVTLLSFLPFYNPQFLTNYTETVALWFQNFEFNASVYYLLREIGFWVSGYNQIALIGKILAIVVFGWVLYLTFARKNNNMPQLILSMLWALAGYLILATTVHPWYLTTLLMLSVFTQNKFPLVWSSMIVLSYLAYSQNDYQENLWIIAFEYVVVFIVFLWDLKTIKALDN